MIDIRTLTEKDIEKHSKELTELMYICLSENEDELAFESLSQKYYQDMKDFIRDGSAVILGAFNKDLMVGFHWGYVRNVLGDIRMHSYFIAVYPMYRRQNIGSRLEMELEKIAKDKKIYKIEAMCSKANLIAVNHHLSNGYKIEKYKVVKELDIF